METDDTNSSAIGSYEGMVDNLVTQFSSALDCFRELVQNSIDAGSPRIDIWMEYLPGDGHEGTIAIHVDDFGEGMDEAIVDNEFTQLFASTKDDDLTKIGKFGIGFVSVFALQPRAVLVHTGRSGEYWEVLFHEDRSFSKTRVENPVEGTQITIFLEGEYHRYQELAEQIPDTLRHWCNHSTVEVTFEDRFENDDFAPPEIINEDFLVEGECLQHVEFEGTEMVLAYSEKPIFGFYNRGLTLALTDTGDDLLGEWRTRFEYIAFKLKSRYLEHTLARDSVIRDDQYERAMKLLEAAANQRLLPALIAELEALAAAPAWNVEEIHRYARLVGFLTREPLEELMKFAERPILRCLDGSTLSVADAWDRLRDDGHLLLHHEVNSLTDRLGERGVPVIMGIPGRRWVEHGELRVVPTLLSRIFTHKATSTMGGRMWRVRAKFGQWIGRQPDVSTDQRIRRSMRAPDEVYFPIEVDDKPADEYRKLLADAMVLLKRAGTDFSYVTTGVIRSVEDAPLFVIAEEVGSLMVRPDENFVDSGDDMEVAINRNHPQFQVIMRLFEQDPAMGAYVLARSLIMSEEVFIEADHFLMDAALAEEKKRFSK